MSTQPHQSDVGLVDFSDWHGWRVQNVSLHVGELPGRKQVCLYTMDNNTIRTRAFFKRREDAEAVLRWIDTLAASRLVLDTLESTSA